MQAWTGLLILAVFFAPAAARAEGWDYSAGGGARWLPHGLSVYGEGGYGKLLWGDGTGSMYGYVRPFAYARTSVLVSASGVGVQLYPVSFFGFELGQTEAIRFTKLDTLDCDQVSCHGGISNSHARAKLLLGYAGFFTGGSFQAARLFHSDATRAFGDEVSNLTGRAGGDTLLSLEGFFGFRPREGYSVGIYASRDRFLGTGAVNDQESLFVKRKFEGGVWSVTLGAGAYESVTQARGFTAYGLVQWVGLPSVEL